MIGSILVNLIALLGILWCIDRYSLSRVMLLNVGMVLLIAASFGLGGHGVLIIALVLVVVGVIFCVSALRLKLLTRPMLAYIKRALPPMSSTEKDAISAGSVWWEAELYRGNPQWDKLMQTPAASLRDDEQAFLDNEVEHLCGQLDDWDITHHRGDLPPAVWQALKQQGFFGLIIPKKYGGREFSAYGHSQAVLKIASRSVSAAVTVMVPNSLGPAELLLHYGTEAQKDFYLPRLAKGVDVPCFALTGPWAGSDAAALPDRGIVCYGEHEGQTVLGLRVNWEKRYITLGPVATVVGLAFHAEDPEGLLGGDTSLGITCALIPATTPGVEIGRRHNPLNQAFMNGPNSGKDVFVPMDWIIGGQAQIGNGWLMLMDCLSAGRGISLPTMGVASGKQASRTTGAYARIRKQFGLPVGKFEGVEEALTRIGGFSYMMDAARQLTCAALDQGEKPSVVSAMVKYHNTEMSRLVINDAMDVHGGKGICLGPNNYLGRAYQSIPIGITVEGANILTRTLIVFGQGAMRCHPHLMEELDAAADPDQEKALLRFDTVLMAHIGYSIKNGARALLHALTRGRVASSPVTGETAKYFRRLARMSSAYAFLADMTMLFLGGALKRKEKLSGRFADGLTFMYVCSAVLKRYHDEGCPREQLPLLEWSAKYCLWRVQQSIDEILRNFPVVWVGILLRVIIFPLGRRFKTPNDQLGQQVAQMLMSPGTARDQLTDGIYINDNPDDVTGCLEYTLKLVIESDQLFARLREAGYKPDTFDFNGWVDDMLKCQQLTQEEADLLRLSRENIRRVIDVDAFAPDQWLGQQQSVSSV